MDRARLGSAGPVSPGGFRGAYVVTFGAGIADVQQLVAQVMPPVLAGAGGNDDVRVASVFEETYFKGGDESGSSTAGTDGDYIWLNVDALDTTSAASGGPAAFTNTEVVAHAVVATDNTVSNQRQTITLTDVTGGTFTISFGGQTTAPIRWDASAAIVEKALEAAITAFQKVGDDPAIGVEKIGNVYWITFLKAAALAPPLAPLTVATAGLRSNGIAATITVNGEQGNDTYVVNLIGHSTDSLINVFDSGHSDFNPAHQKTDGDKLTVLGTNNPDVFLLRSATADDGLAFIAMVNAPDPHAIKAGDPVERVNYDKRLELINIDARDGNDECYIDDTRAIITIDGGKRDDFLQIDQPYKPRRTPELASVCAVKSAKWI